MTTEEKFNAAVNVIRSLPKNGSYQPSNELMLRFYGYFKQATQGPCKGARPAFWDVVGRAKYDAWKRLGDMPKSEAMAKYVDELHRIVETMSYTDKVANFLEAPTDEIDSINFADLELVAGDVLERVRSQPNSPLASREASPHRIHSSLGSSPSISPTLPDDSDHSDEDEVYIDTVEAPEPKRNIPNGSIYNDITANGPIYQKEHKSRTKTKVSLQQNSVDISQEVSKAVESLKYNIDHLVTKVNQLETTYSSVVAVQKKKKHWLFGGISPQFVAFIIAWPFIAHFIINRFMIRKKH